MTNSTAIREMLPARSHNSAVGYHVPAIESRRIAQTHEALAEECLRFLEAVERGDVEARLEPLVLHELSYALPHYRKGMMRRDVSDYLLAVLALKGIIADKGLLVNAVERWRDSPGLAFADAYLAALAAEAGAPVYSKNVAELDAQGAVVPDPLPQRA